MLLSLLLKIPDKPRNRLLKIVAVIMLAGLVLFVLAIAIIVLNIDTLYDISFMLLFVVVVCIGITAVFFLLVAGITSCDEYKANGNRYLLRKVVYFCICYAGLILLYKLCYKEWVFVESAIISLGLILLPVMKRGSNVLKEYNLSIQNKKEQETT